LQDYFQDDEATYLQDGFGVKINRISFTYIPKTPEKGATLNFHLTASEKKEVNASLKRQNNLEALEQLKNILHFNSE
jgi:hypothetical protein